MSEFLPQLIGFAFVAFLLCVAVLFPRSPWMATLFERYGVRGRVASQHLARGDHFRGAAAAVGTAALLCGVAAVLFQVAERIPNGTRGNLLVSEFAFMFTLLGALAFACAVVAIWNGVRWRPAVAAQSADEEAI